MKAIIIENEYAVDEYIQAFLQDHPDLFESVDEQLYCLHRSEEGLLEYVLEADAIVVASTWMYKDQLRQFLEGFTHPDFPPKTIYCHWLSGTLNKWKHSRHSWEREEDIVKMIETLIERGWKFYEFSEDYGTEWIENTIPYARFHQRQKTVYFPLEYDEETGYYYTSQNSLEYSIETIAKW